MRYIGYCLTHNAALRFYQGKVYCEMADNVDDCECRNNWKR